MEFYIFLSDPVYICEKYGNDEIGDGSESNSFKTILRAIRYCRKGTVPTNLSRFSLGWKKI